MEQVHIPLKGISHILEGVVRLIGRIAIFFLLLMVLSEFAIVILRYIFSYGSIAYQESIFYMHGLVIMLSSAYTLQKDGHVRVDILYSTASPRNKALVDFFGAGIFLVPFAGALFYYALPYAINSIAVFEGSNDVGGLPLVYLLKSSIVASSLLLIIQGVAIMLNSLIILRHPSSISSTESSE